MVHSRTLPPRLQNTSTAQRAPMYTTATSTSSSSTSTITLSSSPPSTSTLLLPNGSNITQPWPTSSELFGGSSVVASGGDPWGAPPPTTASSNDSPRTRRRSNTTAGLMRLNTMPAVPVLPPRMRAVKPPRHTSLLPPPGLPLPPHLAARPRNPSHLNNTTINTNSSSLSPEAPAFQPRSLSHSSTSSSSNHADNKPSPPPPPAYLVEFMANKGASAQSKAVANVLNDVTNNTTPTTPTTTPTPTDVTPPTPALPKSTAFLASLPPRSHRTPPPPCRIVADMLLNRVRVGGGYRPRRRLFPLSENHRYVRSGLSREYRFDSRDSSPRNSPLSSPRIRAVELVEIPPTAVAA